VENGGKLVGGDVIAALSKSNPLKQVEPRLRTTLAEMTMALEPTPTRADFQQQAGNAGNVDWHRWWAQRQVTKIDRHMLRDSASVLMHGIELGEDLRMVGVEAEIVAEIGMLIERFFPAGVTFPLGYTDGTQFYLPTSKMIQFEGGYEVDSYHEYGFPSKLRVGVESVLTRSMEQLFTGPAASGPAARRGPGAAVPVA
jgi:hypothetical protein